MKVLVSVRSADEAEIALLAGADIIDAKDPSAGTLGAVKPAVLGDICDTVGERGLLSAALGDATDPASIERLAADFVARGAQFVKVGFLGTTTPARVAELIVAVVRGSRRANEDARVVAVGYADAAYVGSIDPTRLIEIATRAGASGVLVDTAEKSGPGLTALWNESQLARWVEVAHEHALTAGVAGKLQPRDVVRVADAGADIVGVRGAVCLGGRNGRVSRELVQRMAALTRTAETNRSVLLG